MSNRTIEAILRLESKLGSMKAGSSIEDAIAAGGEKAGFNILKVMDDAGAALGAAVSRAIRGSIPKAGGVNGNVGMTGQGGGDL